MKPTNTVAAALSLLIALADPAPLAAPPANTAQPSQITLSFEQPHLLILHNPQFPGGEIRVNYLEAYCRAGSTDADWVQHTGIPHRAELVELSADRKSLLLRDTLTDGVVVVADTAM